LPPVACLFGAAKFLLVGYVVINLVPASVLVVLAPGTSLVFLVYISVMTRIYFTVIGFVVVAPASLRMTRAWPAEVLYRAGLPPQSKRDLSEPTGCPCFPPNFPLSVSMMSPLVRGL